MLERFKAEHPKFDKVKYLSIRLWGGELFFDQLDDSLFDESNTAEIAEKTGKFFSKTAAFLRHTIL